VSASTVNQAGPIKMGSVSTSIEQAPIKWVLSIELALIDGFYFL
jgi:hypothetical protein